jgi:hypothetical protein
LIHWTVLFRAMEGAVKWGKPAVQGLRICVLTTYCIDGKQLCTESLKLPVHDSDRPLLAREPLQRSRRKGCCYRCEAVDQAVSLSLGWSASIGMAQTWSATSTTMRTHSAYRLIDFCCIVIKFTCLICFVMRGFTHRAVVSRGLHPPLVLNAFKISRNLNHFKQGGYCVYQPLKPLVTIRTARFNTNNPTYCLHSVFMCSV